MVKAFLYNMPDEAEVVCLVQRNEVGEVWTGWLDLIIVINPVSCVRVKKNVLKNFQFVI